MKQKEKIPRGSLFIIDSSVIQEIIEGKKDGNDMLLKLFEMKKQNIPFQAVTTMSCFLEALWKLDPDKSSITKLQDVINLLQIAPSNVDYKNRDEVRNEVIRFAKFMSGGPKKDDPS